MGPLRAATGLAALALAGCATLPPPENALPAGSRYVALGSSYAAGAGIPPLASDRPARCGASQASYPRLLAARLNLALTDASCGGATTAHLLGAWDELSAQVDAVTAQTRLVTITAGGNDLNYMGLMFAGSCRAGVADPRRPEGAPCPVVPEPSAQDYARVESQLAAVVREVRRRAPRARVVLVQYVALAQEGPCAAAPLSEADRLAARRVAAGLAQATARAAAETGADLLPVDAASQQHTPCTAQPWSRGMAPGYDGGEGAPWHPTAAGHAAIAEMLEGLLARP